MRILLLSIFLLILSGGAYASSYSELPHEDKLKYWGVDFEVSYNEGLWIKMACMPIVLKSTWKVDGADFLGLEVWHHTNRGEEGTGMNSLFLKSEKVGLESVTKGCFSPTALENMFFRFAYKGKGVIVLNGKNVAWASNKLLKEMDAAIRSAP